jgi:fatty-acyl-CoA synthase
MLAHARASGLVTDPARAELAREAARTAGVPAWVVGADLVPRTLHRARPRVAARSRLAAIAYTSGTTGSPKGVMLTHENLLWATLACAQARGDTSASVGACLSPLTHTPVLVSHLLCRILLGATAVLFERFDLGTVLDAVERFGITDLPLIGGMVFDVTAAGGVAPAVRERVRKVSVGGAPTPMDAKRALRDIFPAAEIIEAYGQTESTDGVTMARGTSVFDHPGTIGRVNPHVAVAIAGAHGAIARFGEEGEIVIGGPTVMAGYWRDRAATKAAIRDGWLRTGDLGRRDADGWFEITGRVKDLIITGGENVSPVEVEAVLRAHPDVADVAVIGTPHPRWGEQVTAVVVARPGAALDGARLAAFAGERLAGFKKPRRIEFVAALPRNAANKVETGVLRERFAV